MAPMWVAPNLAPMEALQLGKLNTQKAVEVHFYVPPPPYFMSYQ